ncbi:hypothetical protein [Victivallis sp. Marseille-Q1083]|uniref:hypothetical protein n=1 Tax=Victivallis sp. Marseille-Q1083 TaxID=2717288 RepID=UPI00158DA373|nr:hypothetical protein [Victivallis sp. Marseille-Q1083]
MLKQIILGAGCLALGLRTATAAPTAVPLQETWTLETHNQSRATLEAPARPGELWQWHSELPNARSFVWCSANLAEPHDFRPFRQLRLTVGGDGSNQTLRLILGNAVNNRFLQTEPRLINFTGRRELVFQLGAPASGPSGDFADTYWDGSNFDFAAVDFIRLRLDRADGEAASKLGIGAIQLDDEAAPPAAERVPLAVFLTAAAGHFTPRISADYQHHLARKNLSVQTRTGRQLPEAANLVILTRSDTEAENYPPEFRRQLADFVANGGGLLVMTGFNGYGDFDRATAELNELLRPFGIEYHRERLSDPDHEVAVEWTSRYFFYRTDRLNRNHAVTAGLQEFYYPGGKADYEPATGKLLPQSEWQTLITGGPAAAPATIAAVRDFGKGRVAVVAIDPMYPLENGSHPAYDGYALQRGDTREFYDRLLAYLAVPSLAAGRGVARPEQPAPRIRPLPVPEAPTAIPGDGRAAYSGILAVLPAETPESDWSAYFAAARANRNDYAVLALRAGRNDGERFERFRQQCRTAGDETFLILPALYLEQPERGNRFVIDPKRFPTPEEFDDLYWPALLFNLGWPGVILDRPAANAKSPWYLKFYTGLSVLSYTDSQLTGDAETLYRELTASDYRLIPAAVVQVSSPETLAAYTGAKTIALASDAAAIPDSLKTFADSGATYLSTGARLAAFALQQDDRLIRQAGSLEWNPDGVNPARMLLHLAALPDGGELELVHNNTVWRRLATESAELQHNFPLEVADNGVWLLSWRDQQGGRLISNGIRALNPRLNYTMCVDKQNLILNFNQPELGRETSILSCWITGMDGGLFLVNVPPEEIAPAGEDVTWGAISGFETVPGYLPHDGKVVKSGGLTELVKRYCVASSAKLIVTDSLLDDAYMRGRSRFTIFRPALYGLSLLLIEGEFEAQQDFTIAASESPGHPTHLLRNGLPGGAVPTENAISVRLLRLMGSTTVQPLPHYRFLKQGAIAGTGQFDQEELPGENCFKICDTGQLAAGDGVTLFPGRAGNWLVFALQDGYTAAVGISNSHNHALVSGAYPYRNCLEVGYTLPDNQIRRGDVFRQKLLVALDSGTDRNANLAAMLQASFGAMQDAVELRHGERDPNVLFPVTTAARDGRVELLLHAGSTILPDCPIRVTGLENNFAAAVCDRRRHTLELLPVYDGETIALLPSTAAREVFIGHPLVCDRPDIRIELQSNEREWRAALHNPTPETVTGQVHSPLLPDEPAFTVTLQPGETQYFRLPVAIAPQP